MVQHQQRRSQRCSTNHQLRVDTHTHTTGRTRQAAIPPTINRQVALIPIGPGATILDASSEFSPLSLVPHSVPVAPDILTGAIPPVLNLNAKSYVHISMVSSDAIPWSHSHSQYRGTPISLFPKAQYDVSLSESIVLPVDPTKVPFAELNVPQGHPLVQLLHGFQSIFSQQEQVSLTDHVERHHFRATVQGLMTSSPHHSSSSVVSQVEPASVPVPIGKYHPTPSVT
jgi:hypothetical protein